jgi:CubicO group peptidase (beta-lactamase class C family)
MYTHRIWTLLSALVLAGWLLPGCPGEVDDDDTTSDDDDTTAADDDDATGDDDAEPWAEAAAFIEGQMSAANIPGMAVAVTGPGEVIWSAGFGTANFAEGLAVTSDTPFMIASTSKTVTATALMQLWADGVLTLDDPIDDLLPFAVDNPRVEGETILVRHLVTHSSTIKDNWNNMPYSNGDSPHALGDFLEGYLVPGGIWYHETQNFYDAVPGEQYRYGNVATALSGHLPETTTGVPLDDHCDTHLFAPLGMDHTGWHLADFDPDEVAMPYAFNGTDFVEYGHYGYPDYPDGQLRTSAADLGRFLAAVSGDGEIDGARILDPTTVEVMFTPPLPELDPRQFVLWYETTIAGRTMIGHNGGDQGVGAEMYFDPDTGLGVVVLMNIDWRNDNETAVADIEELLLDTAEAL